MPKYKKGDQIEFRSVVNPLMWKRGSIISVHCDHLPHYAALRYGQTVITRDLDGIRPIREPTVEGNTLCFKEE